MPTATPTPPKPAPATALSRGRRMVQYGVGALALILVLDALVGEKGLVAILKAREDYRKLETALAQAQLQNARMRERARLLREDAETIEREARVQLGLIKPGEKLFILKDVVPGKP